MNKNVVLVRWDRKSKPFGQLSNRLTYRFGIAVGWALWLLPSLAPAQGLLDGFTRGHRQLHVAVSASRAVSDRFYAGGSLIDLGRTITTGGLFAAYGLTDRTDLVAALPYVRVNGEGNWQDGALYLKHRLRRWQGASGHFDLLGAVGTTFPLSDYQTEGLLAIGQHAFALDGRLIGQWRHRRGAFVMVQGGYAYQFDPVPNVWTAVVRAGWTATWGGVDVWYAGQHAPGGLDYRGTPAPLTFRELGVSYGQVGLNAYFRLTDRWGLTGQVATTVAGRNTDDARRGALGVVGRFGT